LDREALCIGRLLVLTHVQIAQHFLLFIYSLVVAFTFYLSLLALKRLSTKNKLKKWFYVPSEKSSSNAILLGGIPLFIALLAGVSITHRTSFNMLDHVSPTQLSILYRSLIASSVVVLYGYLDDRFELKAWIKLAFQALAVCLFTLSTSGLLTSSHYSNIYFALQTIIGLALLNGVNLLDGIDGITAKVSTGLLITYGALSLATGNHLVLLLCSIMAGGLVAFYTFNRSPARIYMGEAGTTLLGLFFLTLSTLLFHSNTIQFSIIDNFSYAILPLMLPLIEVSVSFFRRLITGTSPFRGDRLHLHHILCDYQGHSHNKVSTAVSLSYLTLFTIIFTGAWHLQIVTPFVGLSLFVASSLSLYFFFGHQFWFKADQLGLPLGHVFQSIDKKEISFINLEQITSFEITLNKELIEKHRNGHHNSRKEKAPEVA